MNKIKIWFGLMILLLTVLWTIAPFWFERINFIKVNPIIYNYTEHHSCHITITEPTIILRMDDVRVYSAPIESLIDYILKENISIVLGVIPRDLEKDRVTVKYLKKIKKDEKIEIAQHGYFHNISDFNINEEELLKGNIKIQEEIGISPISYIPPFNKINETSFDYIKKYYKIISAKDVIKEGGIAELGQTIETYDYDKNIDITNGYVFDICKESIYKYNICIVTIHPQEWGEKKLENFGDFKDLINKLKGLNATFSTFNKLVSCEDII